MARAARYAVIVILVLLFSGLIIHSVGAISFRVSGKRVNELAVTELSLTHAVQRGPDGKLVNPYETEEFKAPERTRAAESVKSSAVEQVAAKKTNAKAKPAPKKPQAKPKPKPKPKPQPKPKPKPKPKNDASPSGGGRACPT